jgi:PAS domain S-box-containing protein
MKNLLERQVQALQKVRFKLTLTENALLESETRLKALHDFSFGGIAIHDQGVVLECNQGLSDMTGYKYLELIGMNISTLIAENSRNTVLNNILTGHEKPYEVMGLHKDGKEFHLRIRARNVPFKDNPTDAGKKRVYRAAHRNPGTGHGKNKKPPRPNCAAHDRCGHAWNERP